MFTLDINPILATLGPFQIRYYGIVYLFGFLLSLIFLLRARKKGKINLTDDNIYSLIFYGMIGVLVGARIFHVIFWNINYYLSRPIEILYIWQGGLSFHGGLLGAAIAFYLYSKKHKLNLAQLADIVTIPVIFILALGRIANFINQEIIGTITNVPWCIKFLRSIDPINCRHPVQLYAALGRLLALLVLIKLPKPKKDGFIFWMFLIMISIGRFFLDFLREDTIYLNLSAGQWLSIVSFIIGLSALLKYYKEDLRSLISLKVFQKGSKAD